MEGNRDLLLCAVLDCGTLDLSVIDDVGYDIGEIVEELQAEELKPTLNMITCEIFRMGQRDLENAIDAAIRDRQKMQLETDDSEEGEEEYDRLQKEIDELEELDPEEDVDWFCNCLDTSIWFSDNEETYRKYLADEISEIEDNMGFDF